VAKVEVKIENGLVQLDKLSAEIAHRLKRVLRLCDKFDRLAGKLHSNAAQIAEAEVVHGCGDAVRMFWQECSTELIDARPDPGLNDLEELIEDRKTLAAYVKELASRFGPDLVEAKRQRVRQRALRNSNVSP
jgi:hypothetical protein